MIKELFKGGLALTALVALSSLAMPVQAADFGFPPPPPAPEPIPVVVAAPPAFPCYFRADVGASWDVDKFDGDYDGATINNDIDEGWFAEAGVGCGSPALRGARAELVLGFRDERDLSAEPPNAPVPGTGNALITTIESYTAMANFYYDLGNFRGFIPYIGAGLGLAYHELDDVYCTVEIAFFCDPMVAQAGDEDLHFAWSVMAGFGYEVSDRVILDVAYRYMDLGDVSSERADTGSAVNPFFNVNNIEMHEVKAGVRYRFGLLGH